LSVSSLLPILYTNSHGACGVYKGDVSVKTGNLPKISALFEIWEHQVHKNFYFSVGLSGLKA
jgi:D-alanyl-D-alanine carboxypeptidase